MQSYNFEHHQSLLIVEAFPGLCRLVYALICDDLNVGYTQDHLFGFVTG